MQEKSEVIGRKERTHRNSHTCEHLLVAVKLPESFPRDAPIPWHEPALRGLRRSVDTDVIVAEVRYVSLLQLRCLRSGGDGNMAMARLGLASSCCRTCLRTTFSKKKCSAIIT
jgi:hypothetical protein